MGKITLLFLVLFAVQLKTFGQIPARRYKAAVVEYSPVQNWSASIEELTGANVDEYTKLLDSVFQSGLDIIVYPEATITFGAPALRREDYQRLSTIVPTADEDVVPCTTSNENFSEYFKKLSCAARESNAYLVANLMEKSPCVSGECAEDNWNLYNTNVAFDRRGKVIARYRKFNLFGEYPLNRTEEADITVFTTDFGVPFGMFTCFDILFETPAIKLIKQGINHIIFPTMWFSELPFLTALQAQSMWAVENNAVFLAAGANNPSVGSGGSGIFLGKDGPLVMDIIGTGGTKVYVRELVVGRTSGYSAEEIPGDDRSIDDVASEMDDFYFKQDDLSLYESVPLNLTNLITEETVCHEEFCCDFNVRIRVSPVEGDTYYRYHMVAFSGVRHFDVMHGGVDVCGLIACMNSSLSSCGTRFPNYEDVSWPIRFEEIRISAKFLNTDQTSQYPNTLLSSIRPLNTNAYSWTSSPLGTTDVERIITLIRSQNRLMTFGIYGRDVSRDYYGSDAPAYKAEVILVAIVLILAKYVSQYWV